MRLSEKNNETQQLKKITTNESREERKHQTLRNKKELQKNNTKEFFPGTNRPEARIKKHHSNITAAKRNQNPPNEALLRKLSHANK